MALKPNLHEALYNWGNALVDLAKALWQAGKQEEAGRLYEQDSALWAGSGRHGPTCTMRVLVFQYTLTDLAKALWQAGERDNAGHGLVLLFLLG